MLQSAIEAAFRSLDRVPLLDGRLIENIELTTTERKIPHNLGRKPKGYLIVDTNAAATVHRSSESDDRYLPLTSSATVTVKIWVF
jgi:hypothetical protein